MLGIEITTLSIWLVAGLSWVIVMMGIAQLSRFYKNFMASSRMNEANILGIAGQLKKMQATLTEMLVEQKRVTRLTVEQLDLKRAEMTGDFEIVEEPIAPPVETKPVELKPAIELKPPEKFPEIK